MITLKKHQARCARDGAAIAKQYGVCMLIMQTRTGKTYTAADIVKQLGGKHVMWLSTKSAKKDQAKQVTAYGVDGVDYYHYGQMTGLPRNISQDETLSDADKMKLRFQKNDTIKKIMSTTYDIVVIDETHKLCQTPQEKTIEQQVLTEHSKKYNPTYIILSATPTPEGMSSLFHILQATGHSPWQETNFYKWARKNVNVQHVRIGTRPDGREMTTPEYKHAKPCVFDATKHLYVTAEQREAGITTTIIERELNVRMSDYTEYVYNALANNRYIWFQGDYEQEVYGSTKAIWLSKLLQITGGSVILTNRKVILLDMAKALAIIKDMKKRKHESAAIFYRFRSERDILKKAIPDCTEDHEKVQSGESKVFIGQVQTCREGIRLDNVDALYMYTPDHSYLSYRQAKNRLQHMTRVTDPELIWVVSQMGYERRVITKAKRKNKTTDIWYGEKST